MMAPDSHNAMPVFGSLIAVSDKDVSVRWKVVITRGFSEE